MLGVVLSYDDNYHQLDQGETFLVFGFSKQV
jgi:hypothetical protein